MPTYDYLCTSCGCRFEKFESMTSGPARKCPECSRMTLNRLIGTGAGVIFKGSGFYETDYRSESYKNGADKAEPSSKNGTDKQDTKPKSESKKQKETAETKKQTSPKK